MKINLIASVALITIIFSCSMENLLHYKSVGIIIGPDYKMCVCCGGSEIIIDDKTYHFDVLPGNSGIDLGKEKFPLKVKLDWETDKTVCKWIVISRIVRI